MLYACEIAKRPFKIKNPVTHAKGGRIEHILNGLALHRGQVGRGHRDSSRHGVVLVQDWITPSASANGTGLISLPVRGFNSTIPSFMARSPTVARTGQPIRSAS